MRRWFAVLALAATPALAQQPGPVASPAAPPSATVRVQLDTSEGRIVLDIEKERAPITAGNFLRYVDGHRLDGVVFYRTVRVQPDFGFVQFGVQNDSKRALPPIRHEPTTLTDVHHTDGAISLARLAPGTGRGDFTIEVGDNRASFDADPGKPGDNLGYAAFGHVVEGMDVVHRILDAPVRTDGKGPFKGETIAVPVKVLNARRVNETK